MMNVQCTGSEENLDLCSFDWVTDGVCNHTMDVMVEYYGGKPTGNVSTPEQCMIDTLQEQLALSKSNLNLAQEELNSERNARIQDMESLMNVVNSVDETMSSKLSMLSVFVSHIRYYNKYTSGNKALDLLCKVHR